LGVVCVCVGESGCVVVGVCVCGWVGSWVWCVWLGGWVFVAG